MLSGDWDCSDLREVEAADDDGRFFCGMAYKGDLCSTPDQKTSAVLDVTWAGFSGQVPCQVDPGLGRSLTLVGTSEEHVSR